MVKHRPDIHKLTVHRHKAFRTGKMEKASEAELLITTLKVITDNFQLSQR